MTIGIDASRANRNHKNGTEWYSYYLIRHLAKLDDKNKYILYTDQPLVGGMADLTKEVYLPAYKQENDIKYDKKGLQIIKSPFNNFKAKILKWPFKNFWTLGRLSLECLFYRPDVFFVPSHTLPLFPPKKSLVTIHDIGFIKNKRLYKREPIGPKNCKVKAVMNLLIKIFTLGKYKADAVDYLYWSTECALKNAAKIITVSNSSKKDILENYKVNEDKIKVIYNGYNDKLFKKITDEKSVDKVLDKYGIDRPYLFYVGKIEKKKNIPGLIEAFAILKDSNKAIKHKLVLVGDAFYGYDEVHYLIREYNLDNDVIMPGWIKEEDMPYIYSGASAFVFASNYEAFGITLLEAMASELPIAASNISSIPEVLNGAGLLFDPRNTKSIVSALKKIISDENLQKKLSALGKTRVKFFNWDKCACETLELINGL